MAGNRGVAYIGPGKVEVQDLDYPKLELQDGPGVNPANVGRKLNHGVILKVVTTNICGSDQHMVRGRTTAPENLVLGHEILGEVAEVGSDVEFIKVGDLCSVPFNIACGRCRNCKEGKTGICLNVNPARPGAAYGYVDMGGWVGGQANYVTVPYADWNLLKFPDRDQAMEKILDLTMLSDIFPTGFHGAVTAGVKPGSTVYVAGAGRSASRSRRCAAARCGRSSSSPTSSRSGWRRPAASAARPSTSARATPRTRSSSCSASRRSTRPSTRSASRPAVTGGSGHEAPATVLNSLMESPRPAAPSASRGSTSPVTPAASTRRPRSGSLSLSLGTGWAKSLSFTTGQCPVMRYNHGLMKAILHDKVQIAKAVNATKISLDEAPAGLRRLRQGRGQEVRHRPERQGTPETSGPSAAARRQAVPLA
jgi:glutathione-independent formaldehyde dehydrogenase